ncbi:hypothetical protein [Sphingobacterium sp.]|uniref:hypothetical protein n=1 Tax=Sphingobacterium sp. TaxID=341027 RepID=UPI0028B0841D|nr:hypothetical protein [Sphingobacterium sp.]
MLWFEPGLRGWEDGPRPRERTRIWLDGYRAKSRCRSPTRDARMDQDYDQMSLESLQYGWGVSNTPAPYKPKLLSTSD